MSGEGAPALSALTAAAVAAAATPFIRALAERLGVLDAPGARKAQRHPVPLLGGLAVLLGAAGGLAPAVLLGAPAPPAGLVAGALLALGVGLADDLARKSLGPAAKLAGQALAVIAFLVLEGPAPVLGSAREWPDAVLTALWMLAAVNAWNFFDNADGALAGVGALAAGALLLLGSGPGLAVAAALGGALAGFLAWNAPPARIYPGDAGSHLAGFLLGAIPVLEAQEGSLVRPWLLPCVMALPLLDAAQVVCARTAHGLSPAVGDRRHLAHRLLGRGATPRGTLVRLLGLAALPPAALIVLDGLVRGPPRLAVSDLLSLPGEEVELHARLEREGLLGLHPAGGHPVRFLSGAEEIGRPTAGPDGAAVLRWRAGDAGDHGIAADLPGLPETRVDIRLAVRDMGEPLLLVPVDLAGPTRKAAARIRDWTASGTVVYVRLVPGPRLGEVRSRLGRWGLPPGPILAAAPAGGAPAGRLLDRLVSGLRRSWPALEVLRGP